MHRLQVASAFCQTPWWRAMLVVAMVCVCELPIGRAQSSAWSGNLAGSQPLTGPQPFDSSWQEATTSATPAPGATISGETTSNLYFPESMQAEAAGIAIDLERQVPWEFTPPSADEEGVTLEGESTVRETILPAWLRMGPLDSYRSEERSQEVLPGDGNQFGWYSWNSQTYLDSASQSGLIGGINIHWLSGPEVVPLPPRLYDFVIGYQNRVKLTESLRVDAATSIGVFSDFEDSARDGIRFPSHLVGFYSPHSSSDWVLGVDYIDRDDIKLLPVFGFSWHDDAAAPIRWDMIFPRPRVTARISEHQWLYVAGRYEGGSWDIELPDQRDEVMTYRDIRLVVGLDHVSEGRVDGLELGFAFDRQLQLRHAESKDRFDDAFVIRWTTLR
ncbi:MAG: hypothetical protein ACKN94_02595 [Pirellulaceae bacterium]